MVSCFFWEFYIKPQHSYRSHGSALCCFFWEFYIKPQPSSSASARPIVVSFGSSTSNHNHILLMNRKNLLFLLGVLHQTTTIYRKNLEAFKLFLLGVLHQTTTVRQTLIGHLALFLLGVLHQTTTGFRRRQAAGWLFLLGVLHQTTTKQL